MTDDHSDFGADRASRIEHMQCPVCDHDLHGIGGERCPECGTLLRLVAAKGQQLVPGPRAAAFLIVALILVIACANAVVIGWLAHGEAFARNEAVLLDLEQKFLAREFKLMVARRDREGTGAVHPERISLPAHTGVTAHDWLTAASQDLLLLVLTGIVCVFLLHLALTIVARRSLPAHTDPRSFSRTLLALSILAVLLVLGATIAMVLDVAKY